MDIREPDFSTIDKQDQKSLNQSQMGTSQAISAISVAPKGVIKVNKDHSVIGISKAYQTGTTAVTSNPDHFSVTQPSHHPQQHMFASASQTQTEILNYPYAYDQDLKHDVDF
jgi:Ca2+-binding EF-hand superfamily protein